MKSKTALVVGGSGMLADFCRKLADSYVVGVVGRSKSKMSSVVGSENIVPVFADYSVVQEFDKAIEAFVEAHGKPELVVTWIHQTGSEAFGVVAKICNKTIYEITGHTGANKDHATHQHEDIAAQHKLDYHRIILGSKGDRWLTNQEISDGVSQAVELRQKQFTVGELP